MSSLPRADLGVGRRFDRRMSRFVRVLYSFTAEEEGELSVKAGDLYLLKGAWRAPPLSLSSPPRAPVAALVTARPR